MSPVSSTVSAQAPGKKSLKSLCSALLATAMLATTVILASLSPNHTAQSSAAAAMAKQATRPPMLSMCSGCHGKDLAGYPQSPGGAPSLHESGIIKHYSKAKFEKVMATGVTFKGTMVKSPMPVFHLPKPVADKIYAYLSHDK